MPKRILLADDSITIQKVVELTFSDGDYEVTAVNNGAKAIQKLGEMRPDIILSDIIMPEKNGYEVCEYVKSHPEYRTIPVVLLTGTFEPFDPDRAEKAGCDAVVTKPFESQSLIHKVEELIAQAQSAPSAAAPAEAPAMAPAPMPEAEASPWLEEPAAPAEPSFTTSSGSHPAVPEPAPPQELFDHSADIFGAPPPSGETTEMPFEPAPELPAEMPQMAPEMPNVDELAGETRAFPRMTFDEEPQAPLVPPPSAPEPLPWDEPPAIDQSFDKTEVADLESMQEPLEAEPAATEEETESPFGAPPPASDFSAETRAFQKMTFDELQQAAPQVEPEPAPAPEAPAPSASPWEEPAETPLFESQPPSFEPMSYEEQPEPTAAEPAPLPETSPWDEQPETMPGETQAFPAMSFDQLAAMTPPAEEPPMQAEAAPEPEPAPLSWEEPAAPAWAPEEETAQPEPAAADTFSTAAYTPFVPPAEEPVQEELPQPMEEQQPLAAAPEEEETQIVPPPPSEPEWAPAAAAEAAAEPHEPVIAPSVIAPPAIAPEAPAMSIRASDLTEDQIDRIARRVVELMSDQLVRNIAWEVIPDLAEMVVKERIRQLESEA